MAKDYNEIMLRELEKAGTGAKMTKVPKLRRSSPESLLKIEQDIADMKHLGLGAEIIQGTMQHVFNVTVGDKMPAVMNTEIIIEDEKIIEIRN